MPLSRLIVAREGTGGGANDCVGGGALGLRALFNLPRFRNGGTGRFFLSGLEFIELPLEMG